MKRPIELGIGFVTGRSNVCKIINSYYKDILRQIEEYGEKVNITFFILYDLGYQFTKRTDFYKILPKVYENINIKYITPENIIEEKKLLVYQNYFTEDELDYILGYGHAKGRNTIMYYAIKHKIDYLLFWDDDEYPVACMKNSDGKLIWKRQNNILEHLKNIENSNISIGYHCGYISPIPYIGLDKNTDNSIFEQFIEAISNEIINWKNIKSNMNANSGITYADLEIASGNSPYELLNSNSTKWVSGSTLCINLTKLEKIPSFYNPPNARGEDTFFSTLLEDCIVIKTPVYHFHDVFLKYKDIMNYNYPNELKGILSDDTSVQKRFFNASIGWIKYKPLLTYITNKKDYKKIISDTRKKLKNSIPLLDKLFKEFSFSELLNTLDKYDANVQKHYEEYLKTNEIWTKMKQNFINDNIKK